jgi:hypothetical protein
MPTTTGKMQQINAGGVIEMSTAAESAAILAGQ